MWKKVMYSAAHQVFCPYGLAFLTAVFTLSILGLLHSSAHTAHWILTETPFYPIQIVTGVLIGFLVGRYFCWHLTGWTWVLPAVVLVLAWMLTPVPIGISRMDYWLGWAGMPGRVFPPLQIIVTMPLYLSLAYSVAASLGARSRQVHD